MIKPENNFELNEKCPYCGHQFTSAQNPSNLHLKPTPGDVNICVRCTEVSMFNEDFKLTKIDVSSLPIENAREVNIIQLKIMAIHKIIGTPDKEE